MRIILILAATLFATAVSASGPSERDGWKVHPTTKSYGELVDAVKSAAKANKLGVVTQAGPTGAAKARGITIPGNRVIGLFNNVYAVKMLSLSTSAMIEAPVRMYVTENEDGSATLSYKTPSFVFSPYADEGGDDLINLAAELDGVFESVAAQAIR